jgi:hypothetical protein
MVLPAIKMLIVFIVNVHTVTCTPISRQQVGKHVPVEANARNNWTSVATQRSCKHASLTIENCAFRGVRARSYLEDSRHYESGLGREVRS